MKAKIICYSIPLLILPIIIFFLSFSCTPPGPGDLTIEEPAQETAEEFTVEEPEEDPAEEVVADEPGEEPSEDEQSFDNLEFKCIRVVDGDTIEIEDSNGKKYKVRYIGINTPETGDEYGDTATEVNNDLVLGKIVTLEKDVSDTDKYGRILAYVYVGDLFVNAYLVENGYAQVATYPPDVKYADYFIELQQKAVEEGNGFWAEAEEETFPVEEETAEENPIEAPNIEYEEIGMQGLFVFIYTEATKRAELQQIVDIYKNDKFKSKRIFELDFFNNREKALDAKTNFGMMLPDATYNYNANIGLDELILYQDD
ncbi:MAG: thermonuclease family protein [Actinobacteria bacterium]|nr:thermonuclease family protein [Actinomycetota bacterium]